MLVDDVWGKVGRACANAGVDESIKFASLVHSFGDSKNSLDEEEKSVFKAFPSKEVDSSDEVKNIDVAEVANVFGEVELFEDGYRFLLDKFSDEDNFFMIEEKAEIFRWCIVFAHLL